MAFAGVVDWEVECAEDGEEFFDAWDYCADWSNGTALVNQVAVWGADYGVVSIEGSSNLGHSGLLREGDDAVR